MNRLPPGKPFPLTDQSTVRSAAVIVIAILVAVLLAPVQLKPFVLLGLAMDLASGGIWGGNANLTYQLARKLNGLFRVGPRMVPARSKRFTALVGFLFVAAMIVSLETQITLAFYLLWSAGVLLALFEIITGRSVGLLIERHLAKMNNQQDGVLRISLFPPSNHH